MKPQRILTPWFVISAALMLVVSYTAGLFAQQRREPSALTLSQAVKIALEQNPQRKAALANTKAASADVDEARSFLLPRITFSATATRGNDPVYVFGTKLRQQGFLTADFALNKLNTPTPFSNFATRFGGTWSLFDSFASWRTVNRAERVKEASTHQLARAEQEIIFHVVDSYYGVLLANKQRELCEQALKTARAILDRSKDRLESGVVVESDTLSARVRLAARKQELIRAQNNLMLAHAQLITAIDVQSESVPLEVAGTTGWRGSKSSSIFSKVGPRRLSFLTSEPCRKKCHW